MGPGSKAKNKTKTRSHSPTIEWEREKLRRFILEIGDNICSMKLYDHLAQTGIHVGAGILEAHILKKKEPLSPQIKYTYPNTKS